MKVPRSGSVASYTICELAGEDDRTGHRTDPFHAVSRRELAEHSAVVQDGRVAGVGELIVVCRGTEV